MSVRSINLTRPEEAFGSINAIPCISVCNSKFKVVTCWSVLSQNANKDVHQMLRYFCMEIALQ